MADERGVFEADLAKLEVYGITPERREEQLAELAAAAEQDGPLVLHHDPDLSDVSPLVITVETIQALADLNGVPDSRFDDDGWIDPFPTPPPYADLSTAHQRAYSPEMCAAREKWLFGDSRAVASYGDAINDTSFPMDVAVFIGKDFTASPGHPLVVPGDGHGQPTAVLFDTVTVEPGGQIIWEASTGKMTANVIDFVVADGVDATAEQNFVSKGADGGKGGPGAKGGTGGKGGKGSPGQDNKNSCKRSATDGTNGTGGTKGTKGTDGGRGGSGSVVNVVVETLNGVCNIGSGGGDGGDGGVGGDGGDGGAGGDGGDGTKQCPAGKGADGGAGGAGNNSGDGGDGGDGGKVTVTYTKGDPTFTMVPSTGKGGNAGAAGSGGNGGAAGSPGGSAGQPGQSGATGSAGAAGTPGTVTVNGRQLS